MTPIARFTLERHDGPYESWPLRTRVFKNGAATATKIPGFQLLHQFETAQGYLLITDDDCPFEEATHFVLLAHTLRVLSSSTLAVPYASFLLKSVEPAADDRLIAVFNADERWQLTIRTWSIPYLRPRLKLERCGATPIS